MPALERIGASSCAVESPLISLTVRWVALKSRTHRPRRAVKCARGPASPCPPVIRGAPHRVVQRHRHGCTSSCWLAKLVRSGKASSMTQHRRCSRLVSARALAEAHRSGIGLRRTRAQAKAHRVGLLPLGALVFNVTGGVGDPEPRREAPPDARRIASPRSARPLGGV